MICSVHVATGPEDIIRCFEVMHELRTHLAQEAFVLQVQRQQDQHDYRLAFAESEGDVRAVAGYRVSECLAWGRFLYVDDLVTRLKDQGKGFGNALFDWLVQQARLAGCHQVHLDSGVRRHGAHRFYLGKKMDITAHHFALQL